MKAFDCDLHIHGPYSRGVSKHMTIALNAEQSKLKGLNVIGTGDILHKKWLEEAKREMTEENGVFSHKCGTNFIITNEIETADRVHHCLFYPDFSSAEEHREIITKYCKNIDSDGRPKTHMSSYDLAVSAEKVGAILGPAHAFTPYFGIYGKYDSLSLCYKEMINKIYFLELGLSADTNLANQIPELKNITFLSNSDSHSPWPHRLGREFNRILLEKPSFAELKLALQNKDGRKVILNAGFDPKEGKYNASGCNKCYQVFSSSQRVDFNRKCPLCGGSIKKGVRDRIVELVSLTKEKVNVTRPPYVHIIPLAEIIAKSLNMTGVTSNTVQRVWKEFIDKFDSEIKVLLDVSIDQLKDVNESVAKAIDMFRRGKTLMIVGRSGQYGKFILPKDDKDYEEQLSRKKAEIEGYFVEKDKKLTDFFQ